jgi:hypothetical protein
LVAPGPLVAKATPTLPVERARREAAALLVAGEDRPQPALGPEQRLVDRQRRPAGIGKDSIDALADQAVQQDLGAPARPGRGVHHGSSRIGGE